MAALIKKSSYLDISHLDVVIDVLRLTPKGKWQLLGLKLGLLQPTLDTIETNHKQDVERCLKECLSKWLRRVDKVDEYGHPTLSRLADALEEIDDKTTAEKIIRTHSFNKDNESSGASPFFIEFPEDLKSAYLSMNGRFAQLLVRVVKTVLKETTVEDVKLFLLAFETGVLQKLKAVNDALELMAYLREHCYLSNFGLLPLLIDNEDFKLNKFKEEIEQLKKERDDFYQTILAADFAKLAIQDHKTSEGQSEMTFKVSWNLQDTTLREFEEFLNVFFQQYRIHISLKSTHRSLLTFVCTIPSWLVQEMTSFVKRNIESLQLNGVVEICIDSTVINNESTYYDTENLYIVPEDSSGQSLEENQSDVVLMSFEGNENIGNENIGNENIGEGNETLDIEEQRATSLEHPSLTKEITCEEKSIISMSMEIDKLRSQTNFQKEELNYWQKAFKDLKLKTDREIQLLKHELAKHQEHCKLVLPEEQSQLMKEEKCEDISVNTIKELQERFPYLEIYSRVRFQSSSPDAVNLFLMRAQKYKMSHVCFYDTILIKNSIKELCKFIENNESLKELQLVHSGEKGHDGIVRISDRIIGNLCIAFSKSSLKIISIHSCELNTDGVYMLIDMLIDNRSITKLTLDGKYEKVCSEHTNYKEVKDKLCF